MITRGRNLFQTYLVDQWAKVESHRLEWARNHQRQLRAELYMVMMDALNSRDFAPNANVGNRVILPPTIYGSNR